MRKCALFFIVVLAIMVVGFGGAGCSDKKPVAVDTTAVDSVSDTVAVDTVETLLEEQPVPKAADELFDDFFFNFAGNRKLQMKRIKFPLPVTSYGKRQKPIQRREWQIDHFFMQQDYYTLIFDNRRQMEWPKDTAVKAVTVEKIYLDEGRVKQYIFRRENGLWMLEGINSQATERSMNASFLDFYRRFSTDSLFQIESMNGLVTFTAPDPDDDFNDITGEMLPEQWPMFKPAIIPTGVIYNILYGQKYSESTQKIFVVRGIANGLEIEMTFRKKNGAWKLVRFEC